MDRFARPAEPRHGRVRAVRIAALHALGRSTEAEKALIELLGEGEPWQKRAWRADVDMARHLRTLVTKARSAMPRPRPGGAARPAAAPPTAPPRP